MEASEPQTYATHRRFVIGYHYVCFGLLTVSVLWQLFRTATDFSVDRLAVLLFGVGVVMLFFYTRIFALTVQNRVIRLEERLRLARLLPAELAAQIDRLTVGQLIGLRFAADDEVTELARRVLAGELTERDEIKRAVRSWRPDHLRA